MLRTVNSGPVFLLPGTGTRAGGSCRKRRILLIGPSDPASRKGSDLATMTVGRRGGGAIATIFRPMVDGASFLSSTARRGPQNLPFCLSSPRPALTVHRPGTWCRRRSAGAAQGGAELNRRHPSSCHFAFQVRWCFACDCAPGEQVVAHWGKRLWRSNADAYFQLLGACGTLCDWQKLEKR